MLRAHVFFFSILAVCIWMGACAGDVNERVVHQRMLQGDMADDSMTGQCGDDVLAALRTPMNEYHITNCPRAAWGDKNRTVNCLKENIPALRSPAGAACAGCFGQVAECGANHCKMACLGGSCGSGCRACVEQHCGAALRQCTGQPADKMPQCRANRPL